MAVCPYCGVDSPGDAQFCGVCGRPFTSGPDASTSRSTANSLVPPPPPPPQVPQRSSIPPYSQGSGSSFTTPSMSGNTLPSPPSGMLGGSGQQQPIRQSYPGQASGSGQQQPMQQPIRQSYPGASEPTLQQPTPPTIRQSYPGAAGTPPPNMPANNQSPVFLPPTSSDVSQYQVTPGIGSSSQYNDGNQKLQQKKRSSGLRILTIAIVLVIVLIGGIGSVLAYSYFHNNKPSGKTAAATATPAPTAAATLAPTSTPDATATAAAAASPTAVSTVTPTVGVTATATTPPQGNIVPQSPNLPLTIPCVNCSYPKLTLVLSSINTDPANAQATNWNLTITNNGTSACSNVNFNQIQLEDPSGTSYQGQGQGSDTWTMNVGQQLIESPTFQVVPQAGVHYTLNVRISINGCNDNTSTTNTYQTEIFTF